MRLEPLMCLGTIHYFLNIFSSFINLMYGTVCFKLEEQDKNSTILSNTVTRDKNWSGNKRQTNGKCWIH